ncbi:piggyBac transposable element-derived protein 4-like isoform X1 [Coccinella septempunctata]|uniref:piggyBac transposable element-derived protein 4-like isoform X1 n=1 Tax=Coccinella septempunctata TaxID=41139 RepID=UPI001D07A949|nr:piggyBac transposable element-derived protein 4-like isoform X1 [Coccinella septempunctata]
MNSRSKRIIQLALQRNISDDEDSLSDPYSGDSDDDPVFVPPVGSSSSNYSTESSEDEVGINKSTIFSSTNENLQGEEKSDCSEKTEQRIGNMTEPTNEQINETLHDLNSAVWGPPKGNHLQFDENFEGGLKEELEATLLGSRPIDYYFGFVDFKIIDEIVNQTNLYATQFLLNDDRISNQSSVKKWEPTTRAEIIHFIGLLGYTGIVRMNTLRDYWSQKWILRSEVARSVMSRNRFELLLKMLHFSDNEQCPEGDRLYKIQPLVDMLTKNYKSIYTPGKTFCIDETMVPFQGRLVFKQYNPQKTHKYGIKLFKLCCDKGYTWNLSIYAGKERTSDSSLAVSTQIVLKLAKDLLQSGRICVIDNWYTSLQLAHILLDRKTHCLGTLRSNRKGNPTEVIKKN